MEAKMIYTSSTDRGETVMLDQDVKTTPEFLGFEPDPIYSRLSHVYGEVFLYAPICKEYEDRALLPWLLTTLHNEDGPESMGLKHTIRAKSIQHCMQHTSLITDFHLYVEEDSLEVKALDGVDEFIW